MGGEDSNMKMSKKILIILIFASVLTGSFCFAQRKLEIIYPTAPGAETPITVKTALPEYLKYVFTFAIMIAGLLAFGALIYGGFSYLTSAGDPSKMKDGQDQIIAGFLGLIIVLSSFLILNTINPQLVLPGGALQPGEAGIRIYTVDSCCEAADIENKSLCEDENSFKVPPGGMKDLTDPDLNLEKFQEIASIKFLGGQDELTVVLWSDPDFKGDGPTVDYPIGDTQPCKQSGTDFPLATYKSISLDWHTPGVYLYSNSIDCGETKINPGDPIEEKIYQSSSATLPEFDNKTQSIKFIYGDKDSESGEYNTKYAVILHEKENFMGQAMLYDQGQGDANCKNLSTNLYGDPTNIGVSSITVYVKPVGEPIGQGVRFWENKNERGCKTPPLPNDRYVPNLETYADICGCYDENTDECDLTVAGGCTGKNCNDQFSSMEMDGYYVALLCRDPNLRDDCEVFTSSCADFRNHRIGQCGFWGRKDCLSSFIVKARK